MKVALRLVILVASLLLVTNVVFAQVPYPPEIERTCFCYDIVATDEFGTTTNDSWDCAEHWCSCGWWGLGENAS